MFSTLKLPLPLDFPQMTRRLQIDLTFRVPKGTSGHGIILDVNKKVYILEKNVASKDHLKLKF